MSALGEEHADFTEFREKLSGGDSASSAPQDEEHRHQRGIARPEDEAAGNRISGLLGPGLQALSQWRRRIDGGCGADFGAGGAVAAGGDAAAGGAPSGADRAAAVARAGDDLALGVFSRDMLPDIDEADVDGADMGDDLAFGVFSRDMLPDMDEADIEELPDVLDGSESSKGGLEPEDSLVVVTSPRCPAPMMINNDESVHSSAALLGGGVAFGGLSSTLAKSDSRRPSLEVTLHPTLGEARILLRYCRWIKRRPWCPICSAILTTGLLVAVLWRPLVIEYNFSAFIQADGEANRRESALSLAILDMRDFTGRRLLTPAGGWEPWRDSSEVDEEVDDAYMDNEPVDTKRRLQDINFNAYSIANSVPLDYFSREIQLFYKPRSGNSVFDERVLRDIAKVEQHLRRLPDWQLYCKEKVMLAKQWLCDPGESLVAFAYPTLTAMNTSSSFEYGITYDAKGPDIFQWPAMFKAMGRLFGQGWQYADASRFFPKGYVLPTTLDNAVPVAEPDALRTRFTFCVAYGYTGMDPNEKKRSLTNLRDRYLNEFVIGTLYPELVKAAKETEYVDMYFQGDGIADFEVTSALTTDILWALGSISFVTAYMWFHIRSVLVTFSCFCIIFVSVPIAYVCVPMEKVTIASFISLFLITVIDIDVVFIFVDFWDQSSYLKTEEERLAYTYRRAGKTCLATTLTTSLSFFSNLVSALQALREFGLFFGISVVAVYLLSLVCLPPVVLIRERRRMRKHARAQQALELGTIDASVVQVRGPIMFDVPAKRASRCAFVGACCRGRGGELLVRLLARWADCIGRAPWCIVLLTALSAPLFVGLTVANLKLDLGEPEVFTPASNQYQAKIYNAQFPTMPNLQKSGGYQTTRACDFTSIAKDMDTRYSNTCDVRWCATDETSSSRPTFGSCWRSPTNMQGCVNIDLQFNYLGEELLGSDAWVSLRSPILGDVVGDRRPAFGGVINGTALPASTRSPLVMEDWLTGHVQVANLFGSSSGLPLHSQPSNNSAGALCEITMLCYFSQEKFCQVPTGWIEVGSYRSYFAQPTVPVTVAPRLLADWGKKPQDYGGAFPTIPYEEVLIPGLQFQLSVVWGVRAPKSTPLIGKPSQTWSYDPTFQPANPWAQRSMFSMCDAMPAELKVYQADCWVREFRTWLVGKSYLFPSRDFDNDLIAWNADQRPTTFAANVWMQNRRMVACKFLFMINKNQKSEAHKMLQFKETWDEYVGDKNSQASTTANNAWHATDTWVNAEANVAILESTLHTVIVECGLSWFGMVLFTGDPFLALLVLLLTITNISGLLFVLVTLLGWSIGPIEVVFLIIFLGFSVTFGLHMAYNFSQINEDDIRLASYGSDLEDDDGGSCDEAKDIAALSDDEPTSLVCPEAASKDFASIAPTAPAAAGAVSGKKRRRRQSEVDREKVRRLKPAEARRARAKLALLLVGGALLSATVSTIGSTIFLLQCHLAIFVRLGVVVLVVTLLSIVVTLVSQPAVLMTLGPSSNPCYKRLPNRLAIYIWSRISFYFVYFTGWT